VEDDNDLIESKSNAVRLHPEQIWGNLRSIRPAHTARTSQASVTEEDPRRRFSHNEDDEEWAARSKKRLKAVTGVKAAADYPKMCTLREEGRLGDNAPKTPDGTDRQLSKRMFEESMMRWKSELKQAIQSSAVSEQRQASATAVAE
jgi:hypothetical protein